jgi:hypothetical protein
LPSRPSRVRDWRSQDEGIAGGCASSCAQCLIALRESSLCRLQSSLGDRDGPARLFEPPCGNSAIRNESLGARLLGARASIAAFASAASADNVARSTPAARRGSRRPSACPSWTFAPIEISFSTANRPAQAR